MKKIILKEYNLTSKIKAEGEVLRVVFLTDMHNKFCGESGKQLRKLIKLADPDLVLVGGDVLIGKPGLSVREAAAFMKHLAERYRTFYAYGNHEQRMCEDKERYGDMKERYEKALNDGKSVMLFNECADIEIKGIPIAIYGLLPPFEFYERGRKKRDMEGLLYKTFQKPARDRYTILLSHSPQYTPDYLAWGADLTLCGHYHGGVIRFSEKRGLVAPDYRILSPYCGGLHTQKDSHVIVSAGAGEHTIPLRINNPREVTLVKIAFS